MSAMEQYDNLINGNWRGPEGGRRYPIFNPAKPSESLGEFPLSAAVDVDAAISAASGAASSWAAVPGPQRGQALLRFAQLLDDNKAELARIVTLEMGKPLAEAAVNRPQETYAPISFSLQPSIFCIPTSEYPETKITTGI